MRYATVFLSFALALPAAAQNYQLGDSGAEVLTAHDGRGNIATVYNVFDGQNHSIQITRLTGDGVVTWTDTHLNYENQKIYAAVMDPETNLYLAGTRRSYGNKYMMALRYDAQNFVAWEFPDDRYNCQAMFSALDTTNALIVVGSCNDGSVAPVRIIKFDPDSGGQFWAQEYNGGGRNYPKSLQIDFDNNIAVSVETVFGDLTSGSYETRMVLYNADGGLMEVR